jgi:hypothetical protein
MRFECVALAASILISGAFAQTPTAEDIMARVAVNQDRSEAERSHYVYVQHARVVSRRGKTVMCEELTDSRVAPSGAASEQELLKLDGRLLRKGKYIPYTTLRPKAEVDPDLLSIEIGGGESDRDLVEHMRSNLINAKSRDGLAADLFPLTSKSQNGYRFRLIGREQMRGQDVFHINFFPKDKDDYSWKGAAYIDPVAYQPVFVRTAMSRAVPFAVRTLLGTNLPGLGFSVTYEPRPDGVWFPVSFGTEFKLHLLFFYSREISIDVQNRNFEKTHVNSEVVGGGDP